MAHKNEYQFDVVKKGFFFFFRIAEYLGTKLGIVSRSLVIGEAEIRVCVP